MSKQVLLRNTTIKIISIAFAILLWFYVITEQNPVVPKDLTIPVKLINVEALHNYNLVLLDNKDGFSISVKLKGKKEVLDQVSLSTVTAYADVSGYKSIGQNFVPVVVSGLPEGVTIATKPYPGIEVDLDNKVVAQRPVTVNVTGNPIAGLANMVPVLTPSEVVMTGAESLINKVQVVRVDLDIAGASTDVAKRLPVRLLDETGKDILGIQLDTQWVNVTVPIANTKRVPIMLDLTGTPAEGYIIAEQNIIPREILITGEQQLLNDIAFINTSKIDVSNMSSSREFPVSLVLPQGIQVVNSNEQTKAFISIQPVITRSLDITKIELRNLSAKYKVDLSNINVRVTVKGPETQINEKDIVLYVDLRNAKEGVDSYEILWEKTTKFEILEVSPQQISLDIKRNE